MRIRVTALLLVAIASGCAGTDRTGQSRTTTNTSVSRPTPPPYLPTSARPNSVGRFACPKKPYSTLDMESCATRRILALNARINSRIKIIWPRLDITARRYFATSEKAWSAFIDDACASSSGAYISPGSPHTYVGGSGAPVRYAACEQEQTSAHLRDLTARAIELMGH